MPQKTATPPITMPAIAPFGIEREFDKLACADSGVGSGRPVADVGIVRSVVGLGIWPPTNEFESDWLGGGFIIGSFEFGGGGGKGTSPPAYEGVGSEIDSTTVEFMASFATSPIVGVGWRALLRTMFAEDRIEILADGEGVSVRSS